VTPSSQSVPSRGGSGLPVLVTTSNGCAWTAQSNASSWITIRSGQKGSGFGVVTFEVKENRDDDPRTGTLTVAGRTVTVRQEEDEDSKKGKKDD
jgi:hypothetical protein